MITQFGRLAYSLINSKGGKLHGDKGQRDSQTQENNDGHNPLFADDEKTFVDGVDHPFPMPIDIFNLHA